MPKKKSKGRSKKKKTTSSKKKTTTRKTSKAGVIDEKKLEYYANKLYRAKLSRYKKKLQQQVTYSLITFYRDERKIKREPISQSQKEAVLDKYNHKCAICGKPYDKDDFEFHHIDGDRSNSRTTNLVLLCHRCHKKVTTLANAKLRDYKVEMKRKRKTISGQQFIGYGLYRPPRIR